MVSPLLDEITPVKQPPEETLRAIKDVLLTGSIASVSTQVGIPVPTLTDDVESARQLLTSWKSALPAHLKQWSLADREAMKRVFAMLDGLGRSPADDKKDASEKFCRAILGYMPNFILFSSFEDVFPNTIPISELPSNKWIADLQQMSDIDIAVIAGADARAKKGHKTALNIHLNEDFKRFWAQDDSELSIDWDNQQLYFWIEENGQFFEPELRSQGRRWHLAFYIRVSARAREDVRNIILIDEPGLYLHANAQTDILKNLEESGKSAPVVFSTHSPYLLEADKLERVRLVQKLDDAGTVIHNKIHQVADKETLTPILTAIGLSVSRGIASVERKNNVIVEGPSDYYYLNAFKVILNKQDINFVFGGSSGNMQKVGTILQGWGCSVVYLYDSDQAYNDATKHVKKDWITIVPECLAKLPVDGAIEDMFTKQEFAERIASCDPAAIGGKNSDFMKKKDKVLKAKGFLEAVRKDPGAKHIGSDTKALADKLFADLYGRFPPEGSY